MTIATERSADANVKLDQNLRFYRQMLAIRLFEERVNDLYTSS